MRGEKKKFLTKERQNFGEREVMKEAEAQERIDFEIQIAALKTQLKAKDSQLALEQERAVK